MSVTQALKGSAYKENPFSKLCIFKIPPFQINYIYAIIISFICSSFCTSTKFLLVNFAMRGLD